MGLNNKNRIIITIQYVYTPGVVYYKSHNAPHPCSQTILADVQVLYNDKKGLAALSLWLQGPDRTWMKQRKPFKLSHFSSYTAKESQSRSQPCCCPLLLMALLSKDKTDSHLLYFCSGLYFFLKFYLKDLQEWSFCVKYHHFAEIHCWWETGFFCVLISLWHPSCSCP